MTTVVLHLLTSIHCRQVRKDESIASASVLRGLDDSSSTFLY